MDVNSHGDELLLPRHSRRYDLRGLALKHEAQVESDIRFAQNLTVISTDDRDS
jgi:hypothetical protein